MFILLEAFLPAAMATNGHIDGLLSGPVFFAGQSGKLRLTVNE
jgi:hypothetical protein